MSLVRLTYASRVGDNVTYQDVAEILEVAKIRNGEAGVTGVLCFTKDYFLQTMEGDRKAVNEIYNQVQSDTRHSEVVLLDYGEIDQRLFSRWNMGLISDDALTQELILRYSGSVIFNPFDMSGASAVALLSDLREFTTLA